MSTLGQALRILSREQCLELLPTVAIGRVGVTIDSLPVILPVNFVLTDDSIVFRTVQGTKLYAAMTRAITAFEADDHAPDGSWGWSVLVRGYAHDMKDGAALKGVGSLKAWAFPSGEADRFVVIETTMVSGRRFGAAAAAHDVRAL